MQVKGHGTGQGSTTSLQSPVSNGSSARGLFREPGGPKAVGNMMYDKRVARGSTVASLSVGSGDLGEERRRRKLGGSQLGKSGEVPPVAGRSHNEIQTETYLEVLSDRAPEEEIGVQTDAALNRPPAPLFVPAPSGVDAVTQIVAGDPDLFDFDFESAPLVEVLVGRTMEQALAEVAQERELARIRERREEFEAVRGAELAEVQRLESEVKRRFAEKQRRVEQEKTRLEQEANVREKIAATAFARSYLSAMRRNVFAALHEAGHFYDPLKADIMRWLPSIFSNVAERTSSVRATAEGIVESLLADALALGAQKYGDILRLKEEEEAARLAAIAEAEAEKARKKAEEEAAAAAAAAAEAAGEEGEAPAEEE